jgi:hypothetical protein
MGMGIAAAAHHRALRGRSQFPLMESPMPGTLVRWLTLASAACFTLIAGCGGDDDNPPPQPDPGTAQIRALHASASTPPVDVFVNGTAIGRNVAPGNQTGFATVPTGATRVQITPAGTPATSAPIDVSVPLNSALRYSAVAIGNAALTSGPERLQAVLIEDSGAPPPGGSSKLRVVHGAPGVGPVDIYVTRADADLPPTPTYGNVPFGAVAPASSSPAQIIGAGDYRIRIRPAGQTTVVYDSGLLRIDENNDLIAVAMRDVGPGPSQSPVQVLVFASTGAANFVRDNRVSLRVVHAAPNLPPLDFFLKAPNAANDAARNRIAAALAFPNDAGYQPFAQGTYDLAAALVNTPASILEAAGIIFGRGTSTTVFATGTLNGAPGQGLQFKAFVDDRTPVAGQAKVRVIHLSPDAPPVDVVVLQGGTITQRLVTNLSYLNATITPLTLAPGTYTVAIVPTGASTPLLPTAAGVPLTLAAGDVRTVVALGALAPTATNPPSQPLTLRVLDDR